MLSHRPPSESGGPPGDPPDNHLTSRRQWAGKSYAEVVRKGGLAFQGSAVAMPIKLDHLRRSTEVARQLLLYIHQCPFPTVMQSL
jgi:hypothetical protein